MSTGPPWAKATTGVPHAIASSSTFGQPSRVEARTSASAAPYTGWVIRGRGPVYARRAKALRFQPVYGGPFIFRRSVGPAKANPFHRRAFARLGMEPNASANKVAVEVERAFAAY